VSEASGAAAPGERLQGRKANMKRFCLALLAGLGMVSPGVAKDFSFTFTWDGLQRCDTGSPIGVPNPQFVVSGVPAGTVGILFTLTDLAVPDFNHGGGWAEMTKDGKVPANAFAYLCPCPPGEVHRYRWTAEAKTKKWFGKTLATATAERRYPE
jgi:hypothetical protein